MRGMTPGIVKIGSWEEDGFRSDTTHDYDMETERDISGERRDRGKFESCASRRRFSFGGRQRRGNSLFLDLPSASSFLISCFLSCSPNALFPLSTPQLTCLFRHTFSFLISQEPIDNLHIDTYIHRVERSEPQRSAIFPGLSFSTATSRTLTFQYLNLQTKNRHLPMYVCILYVHMYVPIGQQVYGEPYSVN
jgi:hypothetical protein